VVVDVVLTVGNIETAKLLFQLGAQDILNQPDHNFRPPGAYAELHDQYDFQDWIKTAYPEVICEQMLKN
jgi:hypothetical protein